MKTRSEKNLEVCISTSLLDANRSLPDIKFGLKIVWKRHAGSWLSRLPSTKESENCRYAFTGTLQRLPWPLTAMFPSGPLLEMKWDNATKNQGSLTLFPCQKKHEEGPGKIGSRSFTSFQMVHTHTLLREGGKFKVRTMRWKWNWKEMKVRWRWKWDESYLTRTRRGERKRRGKEQTPTQETWPKAGKPWKGKGKEKRRPTDTEQDQPRGGRTEAPKPTYHSETYAYLSTRRTQPTCREENTWNRGPMGD